jgi:hypothetical protein
MSKDIWHTPPQTPDVFKSHPIIVVYEAGDQIEQMDSKEYSDLVGERYVNRWCYVDDLIKENDRTRKALEITVDALKRIDETRSVANHKIGTHDKTLNSGIVFCWTTPDEIHNALEQIKALEQKD